MQTSTLSGAAPLAEALVDALRANRLDDAQTLLDTLNTDYPHTRKLLIFPVLIAIQRGHARDAWQLVNGLPDDECPHLKALCLRRLNDPGWHRYAEAGRDHPSPHVRRAMRNLLGCSEADDIHALLR
ncbi:type III secretion protein HrpB1 [Paraburkholderia sp. WSM4175]|uniref:HrpB1 family type III secretion system apparatus protein n=1 Tax=Paraburkholderia sp. WSM4175 TaxID=2991072 RepID=UPI003D22145D